MSGELNFGEVRSILQLQESRARIFEQLCAWAEAWEGPQLHEEILPYVLGHLERWDDRDRAVPRRWVERLARGEDVPWMPLARALDFRWISNAYSYYNKAPDTAIWQRAELEHLRYLDLSRLCSEDGFEGAASSVLAARYAGGSRLANVEVVKVTGAQLEDDAFARFMTPELFPGLKRLDVSRNALTEHAVAHLAEHAASWHLEELVLDRNAVGVEGARALARCEGLSSLRALSLAKTELDGAGLRALVASKHLKSLRELDVSTNQLGDTAIMNAAKVWGLTGVEVLNLWKNDLGPLSLVALFEVGALDAVRELELGANHVGDRGAARLARLEHLRALGLYKNEIGSAGAEALADMASRDALTSLNLKNNPKISELARDTLTGALDLAAVHF